MQISFFAKLLSLGLITATIAAPVANADVKGRDDNSPDNGGFSTTRWTVVSYFRTSCKPLMTYFKQKRGVDSPDNGGFSTTRWTNVSYPILVHLRY